MKKVYINVVIKVGKLIHILQGRALPTNCNVIIAFNVPNRDITNCGIISYGLFKEGLASQSLKNLETSNLMGCD